MATPSTNSAQTDALAKLAEIPPTRSDERERWRAIAKRHIQAEYRGFQCASWPGLFGLMSEARKQGQRDILGASASPSGSQASPEAPTDPRPTGVDPSRMSRKLSADERLKQREALEDWLVQNAGIGTWAAGTTARALLLRDDSPLVPAFAAAIPSGGKERRDERGFVCEYDDGLTPEGDTFTLLWEDGTRWLVADRVGRITVGRSPANGSIAQQTTWQALATEVAPAVPKSAWVHDILDAINPHVEANNYDYRIDGEYDITEFERGMLEDFAVGLIEKISEAALAGDTRSAETCKGSVEDEHAADLSATPQATPPSPQDHPPSSNPSAVLRLPGNGGRS